MAIGWARQALAGAAAIAALAVSSAPAMAATSSTAGAQTEVLESLQFAVLLDMDFGKIAVAGVGGVVELDPQTTNRTCDPGIVCVGTYAVSRLEVSGSDANIQVTFDPTFELTGPGDPIVAEPVFPGGSGAIVHLAGGSAVVNFGARLHINNGQAPGTYTGTFSVNLEYN